MIIAVERQVLGVIAMAKPSASPAATASTVVEALFWGYHGGFCFQLTINWVIPLNLKGSIHRDGLQWVLRTYTLFGQLYDLIFHRFLQQCLACVVWRPPKMHQFLTMSV